MPLSMMNLVFRRSFHIMIKHKLSPLVYQYKENKISKLLDQSIKCCSAFNNTSRSCVSRGKRGDPSAKPHLREYARINNKSELIFDENILEDREYDEILYDSGINVDLASKGKVAVIQPWIKWGKTKRRDTSKDLLLEEACALITTLVDCDIAYKSVVSVTRLKKHKIFGDGQLDNLVDEFTKRQPLMAVFVSHEILTLAYKRQLEEKFNARVLDRYSVVLAIFHQHANTMEAKLQVALAEIPYVRAYVSDDKHKLIISKREQKLKDALEQLSEQRENHRRQRKKNSLPSIAIVGYTNAGKTSLIRALTGDERVIGRNYLFATLDVTAHKCYLPCGFPILLLDTVGFIQDIPTNLIASFMATLEDAVHADVVIHIRDSSHPDRCCQSAVVEDTLKSLPLPSETPVITVDTKIDITPQDAFSDTEIYDSANPFRISAMTGEGLEDLLDEVEDRVLKILNKQPIHMKLKTGSRELGWLRKYIGITQEEIDYDNPQNTLVTSVMNDQDVADFMKFVKSIRN